MIKNSRKFSTKSVNGFSRGYSRPAGVVDPFTLSSLPSKSQIHQWKTVIDHPASKRTSYIETCYEKVDLNCINHLTRLHTAKDIQKSVEEELLKWFSQPYRKPETVVEHPPANHVAKFQRLLYCERYDCYIVKEILKYCEMSPNELAMLCMYRWVSSDHIRWLIRTLNNLQNNTSFVYLNNELHKNPKTHKNTPSNFSFAINVGKDQRGNTYFGTYDHPGNHWSMCHVNVSERKIVYRVYKKNGAHLLCQIISKLLKLIAQFWTCFKPRSFLFRTSRNSYFNSQ